MYIRKNFTFREIFFLTGKHFVWLIPYSVLIAILYRYTSLREFEIPWLPLSIIGTSVAFYIGFKNDQAYDRLWEARIIWGGIVNSSRMWGSAVKAFIVDHSNEKDDLSEIKKTLIRRHIAWLYTLRNQLLEPASWEHLSLGGMYGNDARQKRKRTGLGLLGEDVTNAQVQKYLPHYEFEKLKTFKNAAAQLIDIQSQDLAFQRKNGNLKEFEHVKLQSILNELYEHQGKTERIKKTPFPRQFGSFSFIMICLFIIMLPFGFYSEFNKIGSYGIWLAVPLTIVIGWIYVVMELVGDYSENPFEGLMNDVPMLSICRNIEIDLLQQLGETKLPESIRPVKNVLL